MTQERAEELKKLIADLYFDDHTQIFTAFRAIPDSGKADLVVLIDKATPNDPISGPYNTIDEMLDDMDKNGNDVEWFCQRCHSKVTLSQKFCNECGQALKDGE